MDINKEIKAFIDNFENDLKDAHEYLKELDLNSYTEISYNIPMPSHAKHVRETCYEKFGEVLSDKEYQLLENQLMDRLEEWNEEQTTYFQNLLPPLKFILTNYKTYTPEEVINTFSQYVKPENVKALIDHLIYPELAEAILSFTEIDGNIHLNLGNGEGLIRITNSKK